jgi:hypothetical protein
MHTTDKLTVVITKIIIPVIACLLAFSGYLQFRNSEKISEISEKIGYISANMTNVQIKVTEHDRYIKTLQNTTIKKERFELIYLKIEQIKAYMEGKQNLANEIEKDIRATESKIFVGEETRGNKIKDFE